MPGFWAALLILAAFAAGGPVAADTVCRPTALGAIGCPDPGPRPQPRPIYRQPVQALDRVQRLPEVAAPAPGFVPSRETGKLGGNVLTDRDVGIGRCRPDTLGNLICP